MQFSAAVEVLGGYPVPIKDLLFALHVCAQGLGPGESRVGADDFARVWASISKTAA